jgi:hypothetical protein
MSQPPKSRKVVFTGAKEDPSRAAALSDSEYERLLISLEVTVMPILARGSVKLREKGFTIVKLERRAALASLVVRCRSVTAWLYFQVHRSFGPLLSSERVFWMYSVQNPDHPSDGKAGRMPDLTDNAAAAAIVDSFVALCTSAVA